MRKKLVIIVGALVITGGALLLPVGGKARSVPEQTQPAMDLSRFSDAPPARKDLNLVFIHHSVGGQLLADAGERKDLADSVHSTHENGGGGRRLLQAAGYQVHEASYGSTLGENTDLFDWLPKFQNSLPAIFRIGFNDTPLPEGASGHQIVMFKSCYPNNRFVGLGETPGNATGPELTVWNAKASFQKLLLELAKEPGKLFVYLTAPPNTPGYRPEPLLKVLAKKALGKATTSQVIANRARLAREFNGWIASPEGWLKDYPHKNVVVFDYYGVLTDGKSSNLSKYPSGDGTDNHPNGEGQKRAAARLVPFLNRAVRRAGLSD